MKHSVYLIKFIMISACFFAAQSTHAMQNLLDYIKTYKTPAAEKTMNLLLFTPRLLKSQFHEPVFQYPLRRDRISDMPIAMLLWLEPFARQVLIPGSILEEKPRAFENAVRFNNTNLLKSIISHGYDVNHPLPSWPHPTFLKKLRDTTALHIAVQDQYPAIVKILLESGANINALDGNGQTAEFYAQINPEDTPHQQEKKREIQKIFNFYKAKQALPAQLEAIKQKKAAAKQAQEAIENISEAPQEYRGATDVASIIKGYL